MIGTIQMTDITTATYMVTCGNDLGTAFFVAPQVAITAFHVVLAHFDDGAVITLGNTNGTLPCKILAYDADSDICLLETEQPVPAILSLAAIRKQLNQDCSLFGYPYQARVTGVALNGKVMQVLLGDTCDMLIDELNIEGQYDYGGLSGSPIIIAGNVTGVALRQVDNRIAVISIQKIAAFLRVKGVDVKEEELLYTVPREFLVDVESSATNYYVAVAIHRAIQQAGNWILVHGSPGSGKSTLLASLKPSAPNMVFCGHYFTKIPGDRQPTSLRTSPLFFLDTIEQLIANVLTGEHFPKGNLTLEARLERLAAQIQKMGTYYHEKGQTAVLVIDGLDEVSDLGGFLGILPMTLPAEVKIILSCTSPLILPAPYRALILDEQVVEMQPLPSAMQEAFILEQTRGLKLPIDIVQQLAVKSEGHPLYMRYLVNYLLTNDFEAAGENLQEWVASIPAIGGNISRYYEVIWDKLSAIPDRIWIILIIAQLRQDVTEGELIAMLPEPYQLTFLSHFPQIRYLLASRGLIGIYHQSFRDFVQNKAALQRTMANEYVLTWCRANPDHEYAVANTLFHIIQSNHPVTAVDFCSQNWADRCATFDIIPELVLADIREAIDLAIDLQLTIEVIRLMLLLERISFRYDIVFADQAAILALALISMGKFRQALRYLVREHELQVSLGDANWFLQLFMEKEAWDEANLLFEAISIKYRREYNRGISEKKELIFDLLHHRATTLTIVRGLGREDTSAEFEGIIRMLNGLANRATRDGNIAARDSFSYMMKAIVNTAAGYSARAYELYQSPEQLAEIINLPLDSKWAIYYIQQILAFRSFQQYNTQVVPENALYQSLVDDAVKLLEEYGFEDVDDNRKQIIDALMPVCSKSEQLEPLVRTYLNDVKEVSTIRQIEGVEVNFDAVRELLFQSTCRGYIDTTGDYPALPGRDDWEGFLVGLLSNIGFLDGRLNRLQATSATNTGEAAKLKTLIGGLDFTLNTRSRWERAYAIPEALIPVIYAQCMRLQARFFIGDIGWFTGVITRRCGDQLGLYTEGFRRCLQNVIEALLEAGSDKTLILPLINQLEIHVLQAVQNRRQRVPELLRTVELYGLAGENTKAAELFQQMLYTSMGPDWYKEAQFDLLDTVLGIRRGGASISLYLQQFAGLLDFASGEMTFQSYIRSDKESFAKSLIAKDFAAKGVAYTQFELAPQPEVLIFNAEHFTVDMPRLGDGYILGACNIREAYTTFKLLSLEIHPLLRFALSYVFILNDDIDRFFPEYPRAMSDSMQVLYDQGMDISSLCSLVASVSAHSAMKEYTDRLLSVFRKEASAEVLGLLQAALTKEGVDVQLEPLDDVDPVEPVPVAPTAKNAFDRFNQSCERGNAEKEALLRDGFEAFTAEKISLWFFNYSGATTEARNNLKGLLQSDADLWPHMKQHIHEYETNHWSVANNLIWFLQDVLPPEKAGEIYRVVAEHFSLIVRPEQVYLGKYAWLRPDLPPVTTDEAVANFFIWLLGYPLQTTRERANTVIGLMLRLRPRLILGLLVCEIIALQPGPTGQHAAKLLSNFAAEQPAIVGAFLEEEDTLRNGLAGTQHFSMRCILYYMSIDLRDAGYSSLFTALEQVIPAHVVTGTSVAFDEPYLSTIQAQIDQLDSKELLNRNFCRSLEGLIKAYCKPLSIRDYIKSDKYLCRSFRAEGEVHPRYPELLQFALNMAITPRVDATNLEEVFRIINT